MELRRAPILPAIAALTAFYFLAGRLGLYLASVNASASPVWPASGIAFAGLILCGIRAWPAIFVGAFFVNVTTIGNIPASLGIAIGNTLEAFIGAWLIIRYARGSRAFDRAQDVFKFALAVVIACLVSPTIGATGLAIFGLANWANYGSIWMTWWLGDLAGALIVAPVLVLWGVNPRRHFDPTRDVEVGILLILITALTGAVFAGWSSLSRLNYPVAFLLGPVIVWIAFRLSQRETATGIIILAVVAIWGTLQGFGPFVRATVNESLLILQSFNVLTTVTAVALAAAMAERRRAVAAIEQQRAAVEAANRTKDNFLAMLSHELRTPLTPVIAALDTLDPIAATSEEAKASVAMIRRNVELESQLIDDLLDLTRIARDKLKLDFQPININDCINNVAEICRSEAAAKKIRVHLNLRAGAHFVSADAAKLQQVVWNVMKNAIKFTPENGEISVTSANPTTQVVEVTVRDTGIGMESEVMKRIFDPFEQGDLSFQHRYGGLGLGLAISNSLAKAHGGTLVAHSDGANRGSTFTLTMNTVSPPYGGVEAPAPAAEVESAQPRSALRILLVDDHHDTCTALERLLVRRGHLVAATHDLRSAMETAARSQFDIVISDIALPDGTGVQLMTYLRAMSNIRGIAISGFGMNGDIEKSLQAGFSEHLVKPVRIDKLEAAIERAMAAGVK